MSDSCCGKTIDVLALELRQRRVLMIVLTLNLLTFLIMMGAAWYSRSSSLLSGGLDNLGDALTYALSLAVVGASLQAKARVALFKGLLILSAAIAVGAQIVWRVLHPEVPLFEGMGLAALLNFAANLICLMLLTPYRNGDINLSSAWECSRNDVYEGIAVISAAVGVWWFNAAWPDLVVAAGLLVLFLRSACKVTRSAWTAM